MKNSLYSIQNKCLQNEKEKLYKRNNEEKIKNINTYFISLLLNTAFIFGMVGFIQGNGVKLIGSLTSLFLLIFLLTVLALVYFVKRFSL